MDTQPWILRFIDMPQSLIDEEPETSLEILCYVLFSNPEIAMRVFQVTDSIINATLDTLYMVFFSSIFAIIFGLPLGMILTITKKHSIMPAPRFNKILGTFVNIFRSFPFIILILVVWPLSRLLTGTSIGPDAAIVSLSIAAIPFVARLFEGTLDEVDKGLIEATLSMGASKMQVVMMMIAESIPSLINTATIMVISIIGYSAMAGAVGGGGLGDLALRDGFQSSKLDVLYACVIVLVIIVQIVQSIGDYLSHILRTHNYGIFRGLIALFYRLSGRVQ